MVIIVTGTPGTGKTMYAKKLASKLGYHYFDLTEFIIQRGLAEGKDVDRDALIVDEQRLIEALLPKIIARSDQVIDGHLSHEIPPIHIKKCIVTKCQLPELKRRLEARGYSEEKVRENMDAEIFDICKHEAEEHGHKVEVVWTDAPAV